MVRQAETNIKWMLTISLLFHLALLSIIFSSGIFNRSDLFTAKYSPFSSIQVSIVNLPKESPTQMTAPSTVKKADTIRGKKEIKQITKIEKLREIKSVSSAKTVISAPVKKENAEVKPDETAAGGRPSAETRTEGVSGASGPQEAKLDAGGGPMVSGPVVDMPSFKYDYYLGIIKNKVDNRWNQPVTHNKTRKALIEFTISRKGDVSNVRVSDSSGDNYFDQTALRAVTLSTPFPPLPQGFKGDSLRVHYRFIFGGKG